MTDEQILSLEGFKIGKEEVLDGLTVLKVDKVPGPNEIHPRILKEREWKLQGTGHSLSVFPRHRRGARGLENCKHYAFV